MTRAARFSYFFLVAVIVLAAATHLATPMVTVLFSYFALRKLLFRQTEVAVPRPILRCRRGNALWLGVSHQAGVHCLSQDSEGIDPAVYRVCAKSRDRAPVLRPGQSNSGRR